jgi:glycosyltransferase involved in cell wall biosynthesis
MHAPKVSTTIISFNQVQYLEECIDSALRQTYPDHEIVIRDDASTDGSQELIKRYAARYPQLIRALFAEKNGGLAANRDACQRATTGDYIAWLDADDVACPDRIAEQLFFLQANPDCSLVYFNLNIARGSNHTSELVYSERRPPLTGDHTTLLLHENFIMSSALMFRVDMLGNRGYHQPAGPTYSDWHFFTRLARRGRIGYLDKVLGTYRRHPDAATANAALVSSGVRRRRAHALLSMETEFADESELLRYCLARFYLSQLSGAFKQQNISVLLRSSMGLLRRPFHTLRAVADRRGGRNLLIGFE